MATRQEQINRRKMADEARQKLKSGDFGQDQPQQGYKTRQSQIDAYRAAHPEAKPAPPDTPRFKDIPEFKPAQKKATQSIMRPQQDLTGTIPNMASSAQDAFKTQPVDSRLLPGNNMVRDTGPKAPTTGNNKLDKLLLSGIVSPIVAGFDQLQHGMQTAVNFQQQPTEQVPTTGSKGVDSFLRGTGEFLAGLPSGAPFGGLASGTSKGVQQAASNLAPRLTSAAFKASPEAAYAMQKAAPVASRIAGHAVGAGVENAAVMAAAGQTDASQVGENFAVGAAMGGGGSALKEAAMPLLTKAGRAIMDRYKPAPAQAPAGQLALPAGKVRGNVDRAQTPDVITPEYQFKLPHGDEYGVANRAAATEDLRTIKQEIAHLNGKYEAAVTQEFKYLQDTAKQGVNPGQIHLDAVTGDVVGRTGRQFNNELWYRQFYAEHGRAPSKKEMMTLARQRVENGFQIDEAGNMAPSWLDQHDYHNTMDALTRVRDNLTKSLNQAESKLTVTDAQLAGKELSFKPKPKAAPEAPAPVQELPKAQPKPKAVPGETAIPKASKPKPKQPGVRSNFATMAEAEGLSPALKKEIAKNEQRYQPITNKETVAAADTSITKKGVDKSVIDFLSRESTSAEHIAEGYRLMQILDARASHEAAARVAAKVAADLTKAGQQAQAGRIIKRLSPEGQMLALSRRAEENGMKVKPEDQKAFSEAAKKYAAATGAETRTNAVQDVLDKLKAGKAPTEEDIRILQSSIERAKKQVKPKAEKPKAEKPQTARDRVLETMQRAEDAAWERIKARRNIGFTPGKGNELVDYSIIVANRLARGTIKASNHVEQIVKAFGEDVRPVATMIYDKAVKHFSRHPELNVIERNVKTAEQVVEQWAKKTATTGKDLEKVRELAKAVGELEGKQGKAADIQMQQIMNKYEKSSLTDKAQAIRFMAMLGNTSTQSLNATSNMAMALFKNSTDLLGGMIDMAISPILKRPRTTTVFGQNPFSFTIDMFKNIGVGVKSNWLGVSPGGLHSVSELHGLAFKSKYNPLNWAERAVRAASGGMDYGMYKTQFDNEILKQARLAAKKVPKADRAKFIRDFKTNPSSEALEIADNFGKETTFQQRNSLGDVTANMISGVGKKGVAGKVVEQTARAVLPFIRTPLNILETGVSLTPGGLLRGTVELIVAKSPAAQRRAISHLGLGITGSGMTAAGYYLHKIGVITDANDSGNKNLDEVRAEAGRGAYRFNQSGMYRYIKEMLGGADLKTAEKAAAYQEGDRTFDYNKLQPLAFPVALGAGMHEGGISGGLTQGVGSLLSMSSLKSIQDVVNTGYGGSEGDKQLGVINRFVESYLKSFSPSLLAQQARTEDSTQRQTAYNQGLKKDLGDYYKSRIPSFGGQIPEEFTSKSLPAKVTPLGETKLGMKGAASNYANPYRSDVQQYSKAAAIIADLIDRTGDTTIAPSAPSKKIKGVQIPPKRYEQYQRDIGEEITKKILALNKNVSDEEQVRRIADIMTNTKRKYADKLKQELGIKDKVR